MRTTSTRSVADQYATGSGTYSVIIEYEARNLIDIRALIDTGEDELLLPPNRELWLDKPLWEDDTTLRFRVIDEP